MTADPVPTGHASLVKDRAIRVFKFLRDLSQLRSKTVRDIAEYDAVWWLSDLPHEPGCHFIGWQPVSEVDPATPWVEIKKPRIRPAPAVPSALEAWVREEELLDSSSVRPSLREIIEVQPEDDDSAAQILLLEDHPEIRMQWEAFLQTQWLPWAEQDRIHQRIQKQYATLFSIYQKQKALGENYEVVVCLGYLTWRSEGYEVARHITTAQAALTFDDVRGVIRVGAAADGARLTLEQDMLDVDDCPQVDDIEDTLRDSEFVMWDGKTIPDVLRGWVHRLSAKGEYRDAFTSGARPEAKPVVSLAPAIVMRRRTERTILRLIKDLIVKFEAGAQPSAGIEHLVAVIENLAPSEGEPDPERPTRSEPPAEFLLPLPANDEQRLIVEKIQRSQGVLVQGPPGTGKSHTIANLLCHLLANGKRVLVTSHTARALEVLRDKLPREISALCVQLLGNDLTALQGLENSVREITERYHDRNEERSRTRIAALEKELHEARKVAAQCQHTSRSIREADIFVHEEMFGGYRGTTQTIAQQIHDRESSFEWIRGLIDDTKPVPIADVEAVRLLDLLSIVDDSMVAASAKVRPSLEEMPAPRAFAAAVQAITESKRRCEALADRGEPGLVSRLAELSDDSFLQVQSQVYAATNLAASLDSEELWLNQCRVDLMARRAHTWAALLTATELYLSRLGNRAQWATERQVAMLEGLDEATVLADAKALLAHFQSGKGLGFGPFRSAVARRAQYIVKNIKVNGLSCTTQNTVEDLCSFLEVKRELQNLDTLWSHVAATPMLTIALQVAHFTALCERLAAAMELQRLVDVMDGGWRELGSTQPLWSNLGESHSVVKTFNYAAALREWNKASKPLGALAQQLRHLATDADAHEITRIFMNAVEELDIEAYDRAYNYLASLDVAATQVRQRNELAARLSAAAPRLLEYIITIKDTFNVGRRLELLSEAWQWAQASSWLQRVTDPAERVKLDSEMERCKILERKAITGLASERAWLSCFDAMTLEQQRHLTAWQLEMKKLGKGTGKHAGRHRQQAREYLDGARGAVPAWIMPVYRLADTLNVDSDRFDVIIIDEASQSGPEAMFLLEFANQMIIVGDDKQIKPDVFIDQNTVEKLRRLYIPDIPSSTVIGAVDTSFFEIGALLYGARVRLREHFRCMPEIIQFSNNLCYRSEPLIPLRQFGQLRLMPVVSTTHISSGYQKGRPGRIVNPPEAEALVDFIVAHIRDKEYAKKTFGVISLLGDDQARLIEQMLLKRLGPEEMQRRRLVCGDAYAFQGDERDIMLLSMVSAPTAGAHIGVLSKQTDERRFNVAASRARDQMILFHTATLNDLNPNCMRYKLLEYCLNPKVDPLEVAGLKLDELRALASNPLRRQGRPPDPFDSWFEVDVCIRIMEHGCRVVSQYEIAGRFVDLMAEGMNGRIAVECDGDTWHGPEQFDHDTFRQRELERAGLRFYRPRGSEFYRDPNGSLAELWDLLSDGASNTAASQSVAPEETAVVRAQSESFRDNAVARDGPADDPQSSALSDPSRLAQPSPGLELGLDDSTGQESSLPEYREWSLAPMPDPRTSSLDGIARGLVEIIRAEGPVVWSRVYHLYARAAGIHRIGHQLRSTFNRAAARAVRSEALEQSEDGAAQMQRTVWFPGTPPVVPRQRGPRTTEELPKTEITTIAEHITKVTPMSGDLLIRRVSEEFAIGRLTTSAREILRRALSK